MRKMIRADLGRVLRKPAFYILIIFALVLVCIRKPAETAADQIETMKTVMGPILLFFVSIPIFLGVYSDEFKSGSMINIIGRGLSRKKVIIAKLIDVAIILLAIYSVAYIIALIKNAAAGVNVTTRQNLLLLVYCLFLILRGVVLFAIASFVVFTTWSAAGGMTILILTITLAKLSLKLCQEKTSIPVYDMSFDGLLDSSFAGFSAGNFGWQIIPALLIYLCGIVFLTSLIFNRKELDL